MRGKFTQYPSEFWKKVQMNAGIIVTGFSVTDGVPTYTGIVGATGGGMQFNPNPEYEDFGDGFDNVPANTKQLKRLKSYNPVLSGTFKTMTSTLAASLCPGADSSGVITPGSELSDSMFVDTTLIADFSDINQDGGSGSTQKAGWIAVTIKNALNITGFQWTTQKDGSGEFPFEFHGHYDLSSPDTPPFTVYVMDGTPAST